MRLSEQQPSFSHVAPHSPFFPRPQLFASSVEPEAQRQMCPAASDFCFPPPFLFLPHPKHVLCFCCGMASLVIIFTGREDVIVYVCFVILSLASTSWEKEGQLELSLTSGVFVCKIQFNSINKNVSPDSKSYSVGSKYATSYWRCLLL